MSSLVKLLYNLHVQIFILKIETPFNKIYVMHCSYLPFTFLILLKTMKLLNAIFHAIIKRACDPEQIKIALLHL